MNTQALKPSPSAIAANAIGIGLRAPHHQQVLDKKPAIDWLEVHSENYFNHNSLAHHHLELIAQDYALSFHGIGLSLGSCDPLSQEHLSKLKALVDKFKPALISEHLSWSSFNGQYFNDLLPLPYSHEALEHLSARIQQVQDYLQRPLLIENPTTYLQFDANAMTEWEFLTELQSNTDCKLLLDLNNIYVNSVNLGYSTADYLNAIPAAAVGEIHLAGFTRTQIDSGEILIDTHGSPVSDPVWALFENFRARCHAPALIEWDTDIPELEVLLAEAEKARTAQSNLTDNTQLTASGGIAYGPVTITG